LLDLSHTRAGCESAAGASSWPLWPGPPKGKQQASTRAGDGPLHNGLGMTPAAALRLAQRHAQPIRQMSLRQKSGFSLITRAVEQLIFLIALIARLIILIAH